MLIQKFVNLFDVIFKVAVSDHLSSVEASFLKLPLQDHHVDSVFSQQIFVTEGGLVLLRGSGGGSIHRSPLIYHIADFFSLARSLSLNMKITLFPFLMH